MRSQSRDRTHVFFNRFAVENIKLTLTTSLSKILNSLPKITTNSQYSYRVAVRNQVFT